MINAFTVDVEDYFQVEAFKAFIDRDSWDRRESRVEANTQQILALLAKHDTQATFFILGWIAERYPQLVRAIAEAGHEVASHGYDHKLVYKQQRTEFAEETERSKKILEDITGAAIKGYRAATYSVIESSLWALDVLVEQGFEYDSSIFPGRHDKYGIPGSRLEPYLHQTGNGGQLVEFPVTVLELAKARLPVAGGGYFRLFPYRFIAWAYQRINRQQRPVMFYVHPWEVDPQQPRIENAGRFSKFRHYTNLDSCEADMDRLLGEFSFQPMAAVIAQLGLD